MVRPFFKVAFALVAGLFLILLVRIFTSTSREGAFSGATEHPQQPDFSLTSGDTTYYGAISSNVGVAILRINSGPFFMSFGELVRADGKFVLVTVAIENRQNTEITMNPSLFEIVDPNGRVYSASAKSLEVGENNDLFLAGINPGVRKVGQIAFDVPADLDMSNLMLKYRGGMTGDSATLPLKVNSTTARAPTPPETTAPPSETTTPPNQPLPEMSPSGVQPGRNPDPDAGPTQTVAQQPTPGAARSDGQIERDLVQALDASKALKSATITVSTIDGEVTLSGTVPNESSRELAESIASYMPGVLKVHNSLNVIAARVTSTPARQPQ